jgi:hypothetical protein
MNQWKKEERLGAGSVLTNAFADKVVAAEFLGTVHLDGLGVFGKTNDISMTNT